MCTFTGELSPNFHWYSGTSKITTGDTYRIAESGSKSSRLSIDSQFYSEVKTITCKVTFNGIGEFLETSTVLHFRGRGAVTDNVLSYLS